MKGIKTKDPLQANAKKLRKNMTRQERHLWYDFFKRPSPNCEPPENFW